MAKAALPIRSEKRPEEKKSGWNEWEIHDALWVLRQERETIERAKKIRANEALMKKVREMAARELAEKRAEREFLSRIVKT